MLWLRSGHVVLLLQTPSSPRGLRNLADRYQVDDHDPSRLRVRCHPDATDAAVGLLGMFLSASYLCDKLWRLNALRPQLDGVFVFCAGLYLLDSLC